MNKYIAKILFHSGDKTDDGMNLRCWFVVYLLYMAGLAAVALTYLNHSESGSHVLFQYIWLLALYLFYVSLCCTFFPAPTA